MQTEKLIHAVYRPRVIRATCWFIAAVLLFLALIQALTVTVAWWRNELLETQATDWFWILLLPVLIAIYLRFFSIFRTDCHACLPEDRPSQGGPRGP